MWRKLTKCIENTLSKLFAAQRRPNAAPVLSEDTIAQHDHTHGNQLTLHQFWNGTWDNQSLERAAGGDIPKYSLETFRESEVNRCSHCETPLGSSLGANVYVPIDLTMSLQEAYGCAKCANLACGVCAVERDQRYCLDCV